MRTVAHQAVETATTQNYLDWADKDQTRCPVCRSDMIECNQGAEAVNDTLLIMALKCDSCESTWIEEYELKAYTDLTYKEGERE